MQQRYKRRSVSKGPRPKEKVAVPKVTKATKVHITIKDKDTKEASVHNMMVEKDTKEIKVKATKEAEEVTTPGIGKVKTRGGAMIVNSIEEPEVVKTEAGRRKKAKVKEKTGEKKAKQKKNPLEDKATLQK